VSNLDAKVRKIIIGKRVFIYKNLIIYLYIYFYENIYYGYIKKVMI